MFSSYMFDERNPFYIKPSGVDLTIPTIICCTLLVLVYIIAFIIKPKIDYNRAKKRQNALEQAARENAEQIRRDEQAAREAARRAGEQRKAAKRQADRERAEALRPSLETKLALAAATQAKADAETDEYKKLQYADRAATLYAQADAIKARIKKLEGA